MVLKHVLFKTLLLQVLPEPKHHNSFSLEVAKKNAHFFLEKWTPIVHQHDFSKHKATSLLLEDIFIRPIGLCQLRLKVKPEVKRRDFDSYAQTKSYAVG
jgi:hypothetical protein